MVLLFAVLCACAVALEPDFKFDWTPPLEVIPHGPPRAHVRLVGGSEAVPHKYPYQAAVVRDLYFICGGALISDQFVLTSAYCVRTRSQYSVLLGGHNVSGWEESHQNIYVEKVFLHPNYSLYEVEISSDIAVLKLNTKINMSSKVSPIDLPSNNVHLGMPLVITGWGYSKRGVKPFSVLQEMSTSAIGQCQCKQTFPWLDSSMFCVYVPESPSTICSGDSGGPAAYNNSVMGIASFVSKGCLPAYPQGFTNVYEAKDWIENVMEESERTASGSSLPSPCTLLVLFLVLVLVYPFL
ncbi:brachyurin-like isoform X2 [Penaeus chinensis]|uniref:brachyurin-like isoform X2 n=1 Tax=Penaeus chinensis TaxID=139456 RepID=UPI001FB691A3|nr:brachyurin-like isoform X2 [Penaeus chinensis]